MGELAVSDGKVSISSICDFYGTFFIKNRIAICSGSRGVKRVNVGFQLIQNSASYSNAKIRSELVHIAASSCLSRVLKSTAHQSTVRLI